MTAEEDEGCETPIAKMEEFPHLVHYQTPARGASRHKKPNLYHRLHAPLKCSKYIKRQELMLERFNTLSYIISEEHSLAQRCPSPVVD